MVSRHLSIMNPVLGRTDWRCDVFGRYLIPAKSQGDQPITRLLLLPLLILAGIAVQPTGAGAQGPTVLTGSLAGARYEIAIPHPWNGTLFLYAHGYVPPGRPNPATAVPFPALRSWLLDHGYAAAGSSYGRTGWAVEQGLHDQIALLDYFTLRFGKPRRTIAWGGSEGGIISAGLVQRYPNRIAGAIPIAGPLEGGVAAWNAVLDLGFAFKTLLAPQSQVQLVHIANPATNLQLAYGLLTKAEKTAIGRARLALAAALYDVPGWYDAAKPEPGSGSFRARLSAQEQWLQNFVFPFAFSFRAELEQRAGGNPSWNTGVNYAKQLARSANRVEVAALYRSARLDLAKDLQTLARKPRLSADPKSVQYLSRNIVFNGRVSIPVLTVHTTADGLVPVEAEQAYGSVVSAAGKHALLRQLYVRRAGHGNITSAEGIVAFQVMMRRLDTGGWPATNAASLNRQATALGPALNVAENWPGSPRTAPAFTSFKPPVFLRPYDARTGSR